MRVNWKKIFIGIRLGLLQIVAEDILTPIHTKICEWYVNELENLKNEMDIENILIKE